MLFGFLITFATFSQVCGQIPIPKRPLGYIYKSGSTSADIQLDVFLGPMCHDSKATYPTMKQVANHYSNDVMILRVYSFPLPYHRNSFLAAKATHIINKWNDGSKTFEWIQLVYDKLETLTNVATADKSENEVIQLYASYAALLGMDSKEFITELEKRFFEDETRTEWKYGCTRGVAATPTFMINGIQVAEADYTWTVSQWTGLIDGLLGLTNNHIMNRHIFCGVGTTQCEYVPGKVECCSQGKTCVLNVGCRSATQG